MIHVCAHMSLLLSNMLVYMFSSANQPADRTLAPNVCSATPCTCQHCVCTLQVCSYQCCTSAGVYPSTLSLLLRHLLLAYQNFRLFTTCTDSPKSATQEIISALPDQLIHVSEIEKDPPPLPCENPGGGSSGEWLLAVEDAQARGDCACV